MPKRTILLGAKVRPSTWLKYYTRKEPDRIRQGNFVSKRFVSMLRKHFSAVKIGSCQDREYDTSVSVHLAIKSTDLASVKVIVE